MKLKMVLTCITLSCGLVMANPLVAASKNDTQIEKMQQHWEMIISQKDKSKRKKMIEEHEVMMENIEKNSGQSKMGHMSDNHMKNTMDMHRNMMQMMEE